MKIILIFFLLLFETSTKGYCADEENFDELLGEWYGYNWSSIYFDRDDNKDECFSITKNGEQYTLQYTITTGTSGPISQTLTGRIQREYVTEANRIYLSEYKMYTDRGVCSIYIRYYRKQYSNDQDENLCYLTPPMFEDSRVFIRKDNFIRNKLPRLYGLLLYGYINDSGVRFRENYGLAGNIIRTFNKNEEVNIIGISPAVEVIDGHYQYWYQVKTNDGKTGWVYGAYLGILGLFDDGSGRSSR
jgi:hypothetical protein